MTTQEKPLITFALFAYNQERFIREALEGAFSQTYSPLEIILSDDCSQDRTFEIMQEMAANYEGPHTIILNHNEKNLGIGGHVNRIMEISKGELIVGAAGDDVSLPERTQKTFTVWNQSNRKSMSIYTDVTIIDEAGKQRGIFSSPLPHFYRNLNKMALNLCPGVIGASHAWHRKIFTTFGNLNESLVFEDRALPFRSLLIGNIIHINVPLVKYRRHKNNITSSKSVDNNIKLYHTRFKKIIDEKIKVLESYLSDLKIINLNGELIEINNALLIHINCLRFQSVLMDNNFFNRVRVILSTNKSEIPGAFLIKTIVKYLIPGIYNFYLSIRNDSNNDFWESKMIN